MSRVLIQVGVALTILALSGCAAVSKQEGSTVVPTAQDAHNQPLADPVESAEKQQASPSASFPPGLLLRLMTAEIAAQRGDAGLAASEYMDAAFATRDLKVVEQAMRYAAMDSEVDMKEVSKLASLWVELAPDLSTSHQALAMVQLQRGDKATALEQLEYLLANFDAFDFNVVITLLSRQKNQALALEVIEELASVRPDNADAHFAHAHLAARFGQPEAALQASQRAVALRPDWRNAIMLQARLLQTLGRGQEAVDLLESHLAGEMSDDLEMRKLLARLLLRSDKIEPAWEQYQIILQQQPNDDGSRYLYAVSSLELGKKELATEQLTELAQRGLHQDDARFQLGRVSEVDKQPAAAIEWYRSVAGGQFVLPARLREATLLAQKGDYDAALSVMAALEGKDEQQQLNIILITGDILYRAKRDQQAIKLYDEALQQRPNSIPLLYSRAMVLDRLGDVAAAEQALRAILELEKDNVDALNALGYNLANRGVQLAEAEGYLQRAMELLPGNAAITDSIGWLYYRLGEHEKALAYLREALQIAGYDAEIAAHLGEVLWVLGKQERARHVWQKARERSPDHPVLNETIERLDR